MEPHLVDPIAYRLLWPLWLLATIFWYLLFGSATLARMLGRMSEHWFPLALILVVDLMAAGHVGADLGIPMLFRDDPVVGFNQNSPALWGAAGATVLLGEVWIIIYLFEYIGHYHHLDPSPRRQGWDPPSLWANPSQRLDEFCDYRSALQFLAASTPPFLLLLGLVAAFPARLAGGPEFTRVWAPRDFLIYGLGMLLGVIFVAAMICFGWWLTRLGGRVDLLRRGVESSIYLLRTKDITPHAGTGSDPRPAITASFWVFLAVLGLWAMISINWRLIIPSEPISIVPSEAISMLVGLIVALYFILISLRQSFQLPFLIILVAFTVWSNSGAYKYRLPGMGKGGTLYAKPVQANLSPVEIAGPEKPLLDNIDVLTAWKDRLGYDLRLMSSVNDVSGIPTAGQSLIIVAVVDHVLHFRIFDGDGKVVVDTDEKRLTEQAPQIEDLRKRLESLWPPHELTKSEKGRVIDDVTSIFGHTIVNMIADTGRNSLSPVIQQMVQRDIPMILCPITYQKIDRGVVLEDQWKKLKIPFIKLYEYEKRGLCPSLVVSPMVIESGERMLISNLDLRHLVEPHSTGGEPYLRSAREFFRMFPDAQPTFGLQTAIRLSATFPYVSPAVSLPTRPPRRLVDAGYYDNYGVNLAVAWAYQYRDWIRNNTSGLALIQIYAYPRSGTSADERGPEEADSGDAKPRLSVALQPHRGCHRRS